MLKGVLINIDVNDVQAAIRFYCEGLGLSVGRKFDSGFIELLGLPSPVYLLQNGEGTLPFASAMQGRTYSRHWSPMHMDFVVDNIEVSKERVIEFGAKVENDISQNSYGKLATFSDPFGHGFCLIEFNEKGYDALL
ncbi:VOC family protein [Bdellovibrio sp. HCB274]|uniref:VOC family protein n=1 Tax=Bdellovibrio sp. HCB274 TaxID=3394361 RepID=UPI0039B42A3C